MAIPILGLIFGALGSVGELAKSFGRHRDKKAAVKIARAYGVAYAARKYPGNKAKMNELVEYAENLAHVQFSQGNFDALAWSEGKVDIDVAD